MEELRELSRPHESDERVRVSSLALTNLRCFEEKKIPFESGFNVLVGRNGAGKSTVLDALAEVLGHVVGSLRVESRAEIVSLADVRLAAFEKGEVITSEPQYPARIDSFLTWCGEPIDEHGYGWEARSGNEAVWVGPGRPTSFLNILDFARVSVEAGYDVPLPVFAYYRTDRTSKAAPAGSTLRDEGSRLSGYAGWEGPSSSFEPVVQWFERMELVQFQRGSPLGVLDAAKRAIVRCLGTDDYESVRFEGTVGELAAKKRGGPWLPFRMLSDGVRNMFGLVADLAFRCAKLNPSLGADAPVKTSGVVLIDELDLHLHPAWQRRIVDDLRAAFPAIQFVVTTHSPVIVQSLRAGELIHLDDVGPGEYQDRSVEDILEDVMKVPGVQRSARWQAMRKAAEDYYRVLRRANGASPEDVARLKAELDELIRPFGDNPAYVALLDLKREAAGLGDAAP